MNNSVFGVSSLATLCDAAGDSWQFLTFPNAAPKEAVITVNYTDIVALVMSRQTSQQQPPLVGSLFR
jgi:hypothetical protein